MYCPDKVKTAFALMYPNDSPRFYTNIEFDEIVDTIIKYRRNMPKFDSMLKNMSRRYKCSSLYIIDNKKQLLVYHIYTNGLVKLVSIVQFDEGAKAFYMCILRRENILCNSEYELFNAVLRKYPKEKTFDFYKFFLDAEYYLPWTFGESYYNRDREICEHVKNMSMDDPIEFYWNISKYFNYENYVVDRDGYGHECAIYGAMPLARHMSDFTNTEFFSHLKSSENPIAWSWYDEDEVPEISGRITKEVTI